MKDLNFNELKELLKDPKERIALAKESPLFFANYYLAEHFTNEMPDFHRELYDLALAHQKLAIAAPRSFAKSTIFSFFYVLHQAIFHKKQIFLISNTSSLAEDWLSKIRQELKNNQFILSDFGELISPEKDTQTEVWLTTGAKMVAKGQGKQVRGFRPNLVVCDDMEDDSEVESDEQRKKLENWFWKALYNTMEASGQIVVIGTLLHPQSLLMTLLKHDEFTSRKYKALKDDGTSLWPDKWPVDKLKQREKDIGSIAFQFEFQNEPFYIEDAIFKRDYINRYSHDIDLDELDIITAVDPASSTKDYADPSAIVTVGIVRTGLQQGKIFVLEAKQGRWSVYKLVEEIINTYKKFQQDAILIEEIAFQRVLRQVVETEARREGLYLPTRKISLGYGLRLSVKARDKVTRAIGVQHIFEQGNVHIHESQQDLYEQLLVFPTGDHDDLVDALIYTVQWVIGQGLGQGKRQARRSYGGKSSFEIQEGGMPSELSFPKPKRDWRYV